MDKAKLPSPDLHLFICTNKRETGNCCHDKNSEDLVKSLKEICRGDEELKERIKISKSGCLGLCSMGIAGVSYPGQTWFTELKAIDSEKVIAELRERLLLKK